MKARVLFALLLVPFALHAQGDTVATQHVAPGITYRHIVEPKGPFEIHVLHVSLQRADLEIRHARAHDQLKGRETTSGMAKRAVDGGAHVVAAINGDFFNLATGENENNQVIAGEWWKGLKVTDSPSDMFDNVHVQLAIDRAGRPAIDRFILDAHAWAHEKATPILTVNFNPSGRSEGTALYTPRFGPSAPRDSARKTVEAALTTAGRRGDTLLFVRLGPVSQTSGSAIPVDGAVLAAYGAGSRMQEVLAMQPGDTVRVLLGTLPKLSSGAPVTLIGGWPRILRDGVDVSADEPTVEGATSHLAEQRHPRTAVGFSQDSTTLILLTVDGRSESSGGMTLGELARHMRNLGAWQAMNLDGGGSTTLIVNGVLVNKPSDAAGERAVGNALLVIRKE